MSIHPLAVVSPHAELGTNVQIGPFCVIEAGTVLGDDCHLIGRVTIKAGTTLGRENLVMEGAVLGGMPQHVNMPKCPGTTEIGDGNVFRENVTIHRALEAGHVTRIGNHCLFMVGSHAAHDCTVHDNVVLTNNAMLGGHVEVGARAYLGGGAAVHQFCRIGRLAMIGGLARVVQDVPPFVMLDGETAMVVGLNRVGLRRAGFTPDEMLALKTAYRVIYRSGLMWQETLDTLQLEFPVGPAAEFLPFFSSGKRGFVQERRTPPGAIVRIHRDDADEAASVPQELEKKVG
ncbi:MAG: acyl-ACP--UDP-N-acetylglucosamine O-acyltransferase [Pirellulales bacterium]|nr:acyl-ACP--UDP-N-acetylglucosamine O-acyltransferase [Pirellulales bacterium]